MKSIKRILKWAIQIILVCILLQSCTIYRSSTCSVDKAIEFNSRVKVEGAAERPYTFLRLEGIDSQVYGVARKKAYASKELQDQIVDTSYQDKYNLILLNDEDMQNIYLENKTANVIVYSVLTVAFTIILFIPFG